MNQFNNLVEIKQAQFKKLSTPEVIESTFHAVKTETHATTNVVLHFKEIFEREIYLELGYSSMFEIATDLFGYSAPAAQSRINAMRLLLDLPEFGDKIESGELNLTTASMVQSFFQAEKNADKELSRDEKFELIQKLETKSTREVKYELASLSPKSANPDSYKFIGADHVELKTTIPRSAFENLERLKALRSHTDPHVGFGELLSWLSQLGLGKIDPIKKLERQELRRKRKAANTKDAPVPPAATSNENSQDKKSFAVNDEVKSSNALVLQAPEVAECQGLTSGDTETDSRPRYITAETKHTVTKQNRDQGCAYVSQITGKRCGSQHFAQLDHYVIPFSEGGSHSPKNLRLLCAKHNRWTYARRLELI